MNKQEKEINHKINKLILHALNGGKYEDKSEELTKTIYNMFINKDDVNRILINNLKKRIERLEAGLINISETSMDSGLSKWIHNLLNKKPKGNG